MDDYNLAHPCSPWEGVITPKGYGLTRLASGQNMVPAHRVAYCVEHGLDLSEIAGQLVRHKCDNPPCVQPSHLELGDEQNNYEDSRKRNRHSFGEVNGRSVLTEADVLSIRQEYVPNSKEHGSNALAKKYGVTQATILQIIHRKTWRHL